eukprot:3644309-Amphidinium_carterae.1
MQKLGTMVKLDHPERVDRFLGVSHHCFEVRQGVVEWVFQMHSFFKDAAHNFTRGFPKYQLKPTDCPNPCALAGSELQIALDNPGVMGKLAAKHLMKLMYGARMALPSILATITRECCMHHAMVS